jgi:toxin ParE1/3/4
MERRNIVWRPKARLDLLALYDWIAEQAAPKTAYDYTSNIEAHVAKLANFPERGTPRDDLVAGLRTIPYRRRTVNAYRVLEAGVEILALVYGGRDLRRIFDEG